MMGTCKDCPGRGLPEAKFASDRRNMVRRPPHPMPGQDCQHHRPKLQWTHSQNVPDPPNLPAAACRTRYSRHPEARRYCVLGSSKGYRQRCDFGDRSRPNHNILHHTEPLRLRGGSNGVVRWHIHLATRPNARHEVERVERRKNLWMRMMGIVARRRKSFPILRMAGPLGSRNQGLGCGAGHGDVTVGFQS